MEKAIAVRLKNFRNFSNFLEFFEIFSKFFYVSEWSVIYVGIFISFLLAGSICGVIFLSCKKNKNSGTHTSRRSRKRYTRLEQSEENFELRSKYFQSCFWLKFYITFDFLDAHTSSLMISDSDTENDEEILFDDDLNRKRNGGNSLNKRNGILINHDTTA